MGSERRGGPVKPSVQHLSPVIAVAVVRFNSNQVWRGTVCWFNEAKVVAAGQEQTEASSFKEKVLIQSCLVKCQNSLSASKSQAMASRENREELSQQAVPLQDGEAGPGVRDTWSF